MTNKIQCKHCILCSYVSSFYRSKVVCKPQNKIVKSFRGVQDAFKKMYIGCPIKEGGK